MSYSVFTRTWWKKNPRWPGGKEPHMGRKHYLHKSIETEEKARSYCQDWNRTHNPGVLSRKCEFEEN